MNVSDVMIGRSAGDLRERSCRHAQELFLKLSFVRCLRLCLIGVALILGRLSGLGRDLMDGKGCQSSRRMVVRVPQNAWACGYVQHYQGIPAGRLATQSIATAATGTMTLHSILAPNAGTSMPDALTLSMTSNLAKHSCF